MTQIFKGQVFPSTYQSEYIELLGRFEVGLALSSKQLLIPSFLPDTPTHTIHWYKTKFPRPNIKDVVQEYLMDEVPLPEQPTTPTPEVSTHTDSLIRLKYTGLLLRRFYFMLYMPSGFWPRIISRIMSNNSIMELIRELLGRSLEDSLDEEPFVTDSRGYESGGRPFMKVFGHSKLNWSYWKTGIELWIDGKSVLRVSEIMGQDFYVYCSGSPLETSEDTTDRSKQSSHRYNDTFQSGYHFKTGVGPIDPASDIDQLIFAFSGAYQSVIGLKRKGLEILIPDVICMNSVTMQEGSWTSAKLLARVVDFIDALLEDWFPGLGARNGLPDEGIPKVIRLVPCPMCIGMGQGSQAENQRKSRKPAMRKDPNASKRLSKNSDRLMPILPNVILSQVSMQKYSFLVEELVFSSKETKFIECPHCGRINIADIAPDLMFADIQYMVLESNCVDRNVYIDSGGFGDIFSGKLFRNPNGSDVTTRDQGEEIAIKVQTNKERRGESRSDDKHTAMDGYLSMRAELSILESLSHPHIIRVSVVVVVVCLF